MIETRHPIDITGLGWEIPGPAADRIAGMSPGEMDPLKFDVRAKVGRTGVRYKDHATLLALSAARLALRSADLPEAAADQRDKPRFGVVVSSNLSNVDTVVRVVETIRAEHVDATSAMDLPNASSNVVSASIAIKFGMQGINLMLCNGATSGLDALHVAANCIRAGRADRMMVVGVEVDNPWTRRFMGTGDAPLFNGAVAVVLESAGAAHSRGALTLGRLGAFRAFHALDGADLPAVGGAVFADARVFGGRLPAHPEPIDVSRFVGESYGAEGLVQLALVLEGAAGPGASTLLGGGKFGDEGVRALTVEKAA